VCSPTAVGVGTFAQGAIGAFGASKAAKARNTARQRQWKAQMESRKREWYQSLSIWGAKRNKYFKDLNENDLAAQRGYDQAQQGLNAQYAASIQANEGALIKFMQKHGRLTASGRTGRSINRINTLDIGALERFAGRQSYAVSQSLESFNQNVQDISRQQKSARSKLFSEVAFEPVPDVAPPQPVMESTSPMMGLISSAIGGAVAGYGASLKVKGLNKLPSENSLNMFDEKSFSNYQPAWITDTASEPFSPFGAGYKSINMDKLTPLPFNIRN